MSKLPVKRRVELARGNGSMEQILGHLDETSVKFQRTIKYFQRS